MTVTEWYGHGTGQTFIYYLFTLENSVLIHLH